jgi:hypothetical protein
MAGVEVSRKLLEVTGGPSSEVPEGLLNYPVFLYS